jgi:hypothetical protein
MEAVQGPPSPAPSCSGPLLATRSRAVLSIQRRQPSNCSGQKLSCDPGLAGTPPAFSDNCAGDCPHPRSYCFYSRSNAAFWTLQHYLTRSSPPRSGFYHLGASDGGIWRRQIYEPQLLRQFGGFHPAAAKRWHRKAALKCALVPATTQCLSFLMCCTIGTASNAQHPFTRNHQPFIAPKATKSARLSPGNLC